MMQANEPDALYQIYTSQAENITLDVLKKLAGMPDRKLSEYLNVSEKSLRTYRVEPEKISLQLKEHLLLLRLLFELGKELFPEKKAFQKWLEAENFFFDQKSPEYFLTTITGIRYVHDRLLAMKYGDNV